MSNPKSQPPRVRGNPGGVPVFFQERWPARVTNRERQVYPQVSTVLCSPPIPTPALPAPHALNRLPGLPARQRRVSPVLQGILSVIPEMGAFPGKTGVFLQKKDARLPN